MVARNALAVLLICWFVALGYNSVLGKKPSVTSIQTKYGEWYDCVDFYEQPAFDHPLLRDHKYEYQMSPSSDELNDININPSNIWLNEKGCPTNTVPIKRVTKEDRIRINNAVNLNDYYFPYQRPGSQMAVLQTTNLDYKYYGGGMTTAIYHPVVQKDQYSSSRIKLVNGPDSIAVGWTVNPNLYPDNETHLFIYTTTKNSKCYNTHCPGFIITSSWSPPDQVLKNFYPDFGKYVWQVPILVSKDVASGHWVLNIAKRNITIGYWPQKIFTAMADSANYVEWGGEVFSPPGTAATPPMGGGGYPGGSKYYDCYGSGIKIINENHEVDHDPSDCMNFQTSELYKVVDTGYSDKDQRMIFFGGPR